ncbi:GntR family transcriptional regulator [Corynebacterium lowii]|uniref:GntR family transcriptional regulator n=1 Tax=Corynebacterium lowii TaxID=1544413 RepID=UPI001FE01BCB|nr:GntR family transcriptional regulator [Corynebacterium lowii]MDP9851568.1 GntR family transcriptional regulator [Corynebacterium lowii]
MERYLRGLISSGELHPGDPIPSEAELCRLFHASRSPVRQAIASLRTAGLLSGGQGRRSIVQSQASTQSFSTLLSFTEWCHSMGVTPGQRTLELARRPGHPDITEQLGLEPGSPVVEVLRLRSMNGTPAMLERAAFPLEVGQHLLAFDTDSGSIFEHLSKQGVELYRAENTIGAIPAPEEDAELLGVAPHSPLLRVQRRTSDSRGRVLEVADDRYLPELTEFTIVNTRAGAAGLTQQPR